MKMLFMILCLVSVVSVFGCAHRHMAEGIPGGVRASIGSDEVKPGDTVRIYTESCKTVSRGRGGSLTGPCSKKLVGEASVAKVLDQHHAIIVPDSNIAFEKSMLVERW